MTLSTSEDDLTHFDMGTSKWRFACKELTVAPQPLIRIALAARLTGALLAASLFLLFSLWSFKSALLSVCLVLAVIIAVVGKTGHIIYVMFHAGHFLCLESDSSYPGVTLALYCNLFGGMADMDMVH